MKKIFAILLSAMFLMTACLPVGAIGLDTVEAAAEPSNAAPGAALNALEPVLKDGKGILLYAQSFDSEGAVAATLDYLNTDYLDEIKPVTDYCTGSVVDDPAEGETDRALELRYSSAVGYRLYKVPLKFKELKAGLYTTDYDFMLGADAANANNVFDRYAVTPAPTPSDVISRYYGTGVNSTKGTWTHLGESLTVAALEDGTFTAKFPANSTAYPVTSLDTLQIYAMPSEVVYLDNIQYFYYPANSFMLKNGDSLALVTADSGTYTLPVAEGVAGWQVGDMTYKAGSSVAVSRIEYQTLVAVDTYEKDKDILDETRGILLYSQTFDGEDAGLYFNSNYISAIRRTYEGGVTASIVADPAGTEGNSVLKMTGATGETPIRLLKVWLDNLPLMTGKYYTDYKMMVDADDPGSITEILNGRVATVKAADGTTDDGAWASINKDNYQTKGVWYSLNTAAYPCTVTKSGDKYLFSYNWTKNQSITKIPSFAYCTKGVTTAYLDDIRIFVYPSGSFMLKTDDGLSLIIPETETYTFPAAPAGMADFLAWRADDGTHYAPGEKANVSDLEYKCFSAFCQDASLPAMGYAFEGTAYTATTQSVRYVESMEDDGRDVIHARYYKIWNSGANPAQWVYDSRLFMKTNAPFDPKEYSIVQYSYKMENTCNVPDAYKTDKDYDPAVNEEQPVAVENPVFSLWYYAPDGKGGHNFYNTPSGENKITGANITGKADGLYHLVEYDMLKTASNSKCPYVDCESIAGFAVDIARTTWSSDVYIDYIRAYRSGIFTVTYDTNAPEYYEDAVVSEVAPDTGRGAGIGYLLKGERPVVEGQIFRGWALTPDATPDEVTDSVDLTGDLTVYAVWTKADAGVIAPNAENTASIRSGADGVNGIRFRSSVKADAKAFLDEYGFLVARKDILGDSDLTFAFKAPDANKPLYISGAAYSKEDNVDLQYEVKPDGTTVFTVVCVNIPEAHYSTELVARPYAKYSNNNGLAFTLYGTSVTRSIAQVAQSIKDAGGEDYTNNQAYIDSILGA